MKRHKTTIRKDEVAPPFNPTWTVTCTCGWWNFGISPHHAQVIEAKHKKDAHPGRVAFLCLPRARGGHMAGQVRFNLKGIPLGKEGHENLELDLHSRGWAILCREEFAEARRLILRRDKIERIYGKGALEALEKYAPIRGLELRPSTRGYAIGGRVRPIIAPNPGYTLVRFDYAALEDKYKEWHKKGT